MRDEIVVTVVEKLRQTLRKREDSANCLVRWSIGALRPMVHSARTVKTFLSDRDYRAVALLKAFHGRRLHQTTVVTSMDRYPGIFGACQEYFGVRDDLEILSYGCATGEEVITLREYFPSARIVGTEINPRCLAICRARQVDDRIAFIDSDADMIRREGPFDAIFCMAVLQRTPHAVEAQGVKSLAQTYPFEKFDAQVSAFDGWLRPGGLLIMHNTQYVFSDASVASRYAPLAQQPEPVRSGPRFDRNSTLIEGHVATPSVFVRQRT